MKNIQKMKKMKNASKVLVFVLLMMMNWSCNRNEKFETVTFPDFQVDLPEYMTEVDLQNPNAQLQYGDILKEHYVLVIEERVSDLESLGFDFTIEDYMDFALENVLNTISNSKSERLNETVKNDTGIDYITYKIWGTFDEEDIDVYYRLTVYKSDDNFYNLMTWCMAEDERAYEPIMDKMVKSFKEL